MSIDSSTPTKSRTSLARAASMGATRRALTTDLPYSRTSHD